MPTLNHIVLFSFLALTYSCSKVNCDKEETTCAAIPDKFKSMVPYEVGQSLRFVNDKGNTLNFDIEHTSQGNASRSTCTHTDSDMDECICYCSVSLGYYAFTDNTTRIQNEKARSLSFSVNDGSDGVGSSFGVGMGIFHSFFWVSVEPLILGNKEKMLDSLKLGDSTYYDVIECEIETDTTVINGYTQRTPVVWKAYFSMSKGLLGFYDLDTKSIFYLE